MQIGAVSDSAVPSFRLSSSPQDAFAHPSWVRAEGQVLDAVCHGERVLLLGLPGTGKTLLLRRLERILRGRGLDVRHLRTGDPLDDLPSDAVLLIDEAARLTGAELANLSFRPNALVAAGLPSLSELQWACSAGFRSVALGPLSPQDVARFVLARLAASGLPRGMFTPEALVALARQSGGLMRLVIILGGAALFIAGQRGAAEVTADDVSEAAPMRSVVPVEAEPDTVPGEAILGMETAGEPVWLTPVEVRPRPWARSLAVAGLTGWVCASLAVIAVASIAARKISSLPPLAVQEAYGLPAPPLVSAASPNLVSLPTAEPAPSMPVQTAWASPPIPEPIPSPEPGRSGTDLLLAAGPALPDAAEPSTVIEFAGPILNDTMGQGGQLSLQLRTRGVHGPVAAVFHASKGLIGSGLLNGAIGTDGRITLSGRLMMGRNPFDCALEGTFKGGRLVGAATFIRATSGAAAHSSFTLTRL